MNNWQIQALEEEQRALMARLVEIHRQLKPYFWQGCEVEHSADSRYSLRNSAALKRYGYSRKSENALIEIGAPHKRFVLGGCKIWFNPEELDAWMQEHAPHRQRCE